MSAWLVNKAHIDVLVTAIVDAKVPGEFTVIPPTEDWIGDILWQENVKSLAARYPSHYGPGGDEVEHLPKPNSYKFKARPVRDVTYIYKQAACYSYQSCEHDGWTDSQASAVIRWLEDKIRRRIGATDEEITSHVGYRKATWGVEVKEDNTLWLDADEYWTWFHAERKRLEGSSNG